MRKIFFLGFIVFVLIACESTPRYEGLREISDVEKDSFYIVFDTFNPTGYGLNARFANKTYCIIDTSEHLFIQKIKELDFDGDSSLDVLLSVSESWGGNCCGVEYFFVTYLGNGKFIRTSKTTDSFSEPLIEKWNGQQSIVLHTTNAGVNNDDHREVYNRYVLKQGHLMRVEEMRPVELEAIREMRAKEFSFEANNEIHKLEFDLDNDGKSDTIIGSFYERWGSINWEIKFSNGNFFESDISCKRIGVLKTTTNNVFDLVVDLNSVLIWDGKKYKGIKESNTQF